VGVGGWGVQSNEQEKLGFLVKKRKRILEALFTYFNYFTFPKVPKPTKKKKQKNKKTIKQTNNSSINFVICWIGKEHLSRATVLGIYVGLMI